MVISKENKDFLIENVEGAKELIDADNVNDLLSVIEDLIVELEIEYEDNPPKLLLLLDEIYDTIDEENPDTP